MRRAGCFSIRDFRPWAAVSFFVIIFTKWFLPGAIPFGIFDVWEIRGGFFDWWSVSRPVFLWGAGLTALLSLLTKNPPLRNFLAEKDFVSGTADSLYAGMSEEIAFRWLIFLACIPSVKVLNFFFFSVS